MRPCMRHPLGANLHPDTVRYILDGCPVTEMPDELQATIVTGTYVAEHLSAKGSAEHLEGEDRSAVYMRERFFYSSTDCLDEMYRSDSDG